MKTSIIISVYKDVQALQAILWGLEIQTIKNFEIIITEDGEDPSMSEFISDYKINHQSTIIHHLTQLDDGFRKTRAVNRAMQSAEGEYLIFIDGDCVPHPEFVQMHLKHSKKNIFCLGRRMHLGSNESKLVRANPSRILKFSTWPKLLLSIVSLHLDSVRNYEIGAPSNFLHRLLSSHKISIVGCNFSCFKEDILKINGYDEDLPGAGGEDGDLGWRFEGMGIFPKNIKFQAIVYHLDHPARRHLADVNASITAKNQALKRFVCLNGIQKFGQKDETMV